MNVYATATADSMNARAREARRLQGLDDLDFWNEPEQVAARAFHAAVVRRRQLHGAVSAAEFALDRAHEVRLHAGVLLGLAEGNRYGGVGPIVSAETRLRLAIRNVVEAELAHEAAVAALAEHDALQGSEPVQ